MHGRTHPSNLPALKRRTSPQPELSSRITPSPGTKDTSHIKGLGETPAASTTAAAASNAFGQPWTTPATLNSLSASLVQQHRPNALAQGEPHHGGHARAMARGANATTSPLKSFPVMAVGDREDAHKNHVSTGNERATDRSFDDAALAHASHPSDSLYPPQSTTSAAAVARAERLKELEAYVLQRASRHATMPERQKAVHKTLSLLTTLHPTLANVLDSVQRYTEDMSVVVRRAADDKAEALHQQREKLYVEFETFFEGKIKELVIAHQRAEARAAAEHAAAFTVRQERDNELMEAKEELLRRLNECERTEEQFRDFRHLIASVFQTNQQLSLRIEQLESVLSRHRIDIPPATEELAAYTTSSEARTTGGGQNNGGGNGSDTGGYANGAGDGTEGRSLSAQVPVAFMAAANKELVKSRLTLQQELLHSAFDDHSAYRLRIEGLTRKNQDLTFHIAELEEKMKELHAYIHQKRFITRIDENGDETTPLTPRPREVPLALQTELGIELRHSTANILTELSTVALNMKHQLNSALLRSRQLHALSTWLHEGDAAGDTTTGAGAVGAMVQQITESSVIPVFPVASWPTIPHFLRTNVSPEVRNCFWTEAQAGCIFYNFFSAYKAIRARTRFVRDGKMLAPRVYQLFEHRRVLLTRLDANKEDVAQSVEKVPFGYVVSQFAREVLTQLSPQNAQDALPLVLPGTISTRYPLNPPAKAVLEANRGNRSAHRASTAQSKAYAKYAAAAGGAMNLEDCEWTEAAPVVELDWTRFTYNMWYSAMRYQQTQPLCQLFTDLVDGRLPLETFDVMESVLARVQRLVDQLDTERTQRYNYPRLANGVVRWVNDTGAQPVLRGVQAVVRAFEENHSPIHGGVLGPLALFADETYCDREEISSPLLAEAALRKQHASFVPASGNTAAKGAAASREQPKTPLPGTLVVRQLPLPSTSPIAASSLALPPLGATAFVRYWRWFVRDMLEGVYSRIEAVLSPLVEESEAVVGLYLLSVPRARSALAELDSVERLAALRTAMFGSDGSAGIAFGGRGQSPQDALTGAKLVAEAADLLGVHGVARGFITLLESRKGALQEKKTVEQQVETETVMKALRQLPRFKVSTHFPFRQESADAATLNAGDGEWNEDGASSPTAQSIAAAAEEPLATGKKTGKNRGASPGKASKRRLKSRVASPTDAKGDPLPSMADRKDSRLSSQRAKRTEARRSQGRSSNSATMGSVTFTEATPPSAEIIKNESAVVAFGELMSSSKEGALVEWYTFRHTLRQTVPDFPFLLFRPDAFERAEEAEKFARNPVAKVIVETQPTVLTGVGKKN